MFSSRTLADCEARAAAVNDRWGEERAIAIACDTSDQQQIRDLAAATLDHWGRVDILLGNALVANTGTAWIEKFDPEQMTLALVGNVTNNLILTQAVVSGMRERRSGSIIYISSTAGVAALEEM